jgi:hypothetical protein
MYNTIFKNVQHNDYPIVSYKRQLSSDIATIFCPYIPLSITGLFPTAIESIYDKFTYKFFASYFINSEVIDWLANDCVWNYSLVSKIDKSYETYLCFEDIKGSIEFKLRWCNADKS